MKMGGRKPVDHVSTIPVRHRPRATVNAFLENSALSPRQEERQSLNSFLFERRPRT